MVLAIIAGLGTFLLANVVLSIAYGIATGASQYLNAILRFSVFGLPIKVVGWFGATWLALSVFEAVASR